MRNITVSTQMGLACNDVVVRPIADPYFLVEWEASLGFDPPGESPTGELVIGLSGVRGRTPLEALSQLLGIVIGTPSFALSSEAVQRATQAIHIAIDVWSRALAPSEKRFLAVLVRADGSVYLAEGGSDHHVDTPLRASAHGVTRRWARPEECLDLFRPGQQ